MIFINTAGHGYLKITLKQLEKALKNGYEPTSCSFMNKNSVLLEEDLDAPNFIKTILKNPDNFPKYKDIKTPKEFWGTIKEVYQNDLKRNLYVGIAQNLEELNTFLNKNKDYYNSENGDIITMYNKEKFTSLGSFQGKKLIVKDKEEKLWTLPIVLVDKIEKKLEVKIKNNNVGD
jgi:hypothetical protein